MFTLFFVMLGSSAALFGAWVEREGPRKAGCRGGVLLERRVLRLARSGVHLHQIWLLWLGSGVIGGCGLGLGYISPVSTLIKWFPDRRGMATGLAIMGFGGGAMIGTPLADALMKHFATPDSVGVWQTFVVIGVDLLRGDDGRRVRLSPAGAGMDARRMDAARRHATGANAASVPVERGLDDAAVLAAVGACCASTSAPGIGVLGIASPMIQEIFKGRVTASAAAGFTGLLSLFNIGGRIFWASLSDRIGRKATYTVFFVLGMLLYASAPTTGATREPRALRRRVLRDPDDVRRRIRDDSGVPGRPVRRGNVGAIHGRLLTAWSTAGILGPVLVNYIREFQIAHGVAASNAYTFTMYVLVAFLGVGFVCNLAVRPVERRLFTLMPAAKPAGATGTTTDVPAGEWGLVAIAWLLAGIPIAWGVYKTLTLVSQMFR